MTRDELIARIGEAYETYRRLPDPDRRYRVTSMSSWPLYVRDAVDVVDKGLAALQLALARKAEAHAATVMPGFTPANMTTSAGFMSASWRNSSGGRSADLRAASR